MYFRRKFVASNNDDGAQKHFGKIDPVLVWLEREREKARRGFIFRVDASELERIIRRTKFFPIYNFVVLKI